MTKLRRCLVALVVVQVVFSVFVPGVAVAASVDNPSNVPDSQVFNVSSDGQIEGWERAAYTLRVDDTDADTQITQPSVVQGERLGAGATFTSGNDGTDSKSLVREFGNDRNPMGVHQSGDQVTLSFDANQATAGTFSALNNQDRVELVAARLDESSGSGLPSSGLSSLNLLSDVEEANGDATFQLLENSVSLSNTGTLEHTSSFSSGQYVVFATVHEPGADGIETGATSSDPALDQGNISIDGDVVIIGMDTLSVHKDEADVDTPSGSSPGDELEFDIDTTAAFSSSDDGDITHAVAVYKKSTFEESRFDLVVDESAFGSQFDVESDTQLEHSIETVNGVVQWDAVPNGEVRRPVSASDAIAFLADEIDSPSPDTDPITAGGDSNTDYEELDASVTVIDGADREATVTVDTFDNFTSGQYQYVVLSSVDGDNAEMSTTTGKVRLRPTSAGGGGGGGGGGGSGGRGPPAVVNPPVNRGPGGASATIGSLSPGQSVQLAIGSPSTNGVALNQISFTASGSAKNGLVTAKTSSQPPSGVSAPSQLGSVFQYVQVSTTNLPASAVSNGTFNFQVSQQQLAASGMNPSDVTMQRYNNGTWEELQITYLGNGTYEAVSPNGFSTFAIGVKAPSITITDTSVSATETAVGESVDVTTTVENTGESDGEITLEVTQNGDVVETTTVSVDAGESATETISLTLDDAGEYEIAVNGEAAGTVTAAADDTPTASPTVSTTTATEDQPDETATTEGDGPGFTAAIALVALVAAALIAIRRKEQ